ncbi:hypothetical protein C492_00464 [Natronococcus jeotgali DSM 18795]|uniref:Uncharacterized protein n=1 Tax=Natronococcus jeotgali DSM 18795 TaxID=1227498 RepID=L9XY48_9EURY|nr:hypothetical protein C492_00464 [Natronococcus jeotgali DSM 18795]
MWGRGQLVSDPDEKAAEDGESRSKAFDEAIPRGDRNEVLREEIGKGNADAAREFLKNDIEDDVEQYEDYAETFLEAFPDAPEWAAYLSAKVDENAADLEALKAALEVEEKQSFGTL